MQQGWIKQNIKTLLTVNKFSKKLQIIEKVSKAVKV